MILNLRSVKLWIRVSVASLFLYNLYWLVDSFIGDGYRIGFGMVVEAFKAFFSFQLPTIWVAGHASSTMGLMVRFFELLLASFLVYEFFQRRKSFFSLRKKLSAVFLLEGVYFLCFLLPATMLAWLGAELYVSQSYIFAASYFLQILIIVPLMVLLAVKVHKNDAATVRFFALAFAGYIAAIWINNNSRWLATAGLFDGKFLLSTNELFGFANSIICLSIALVYAMYWCRSVWKNKPCTSGFRLLGFSLTFLGAHFLIYLAYSSFVGALNSVMLIEVWMTPFFGLGASLLQATSSAETEA